MDFHRFKLGKFDCAIIKDLDFVYQAKDFAINAQEQELADCVRKYHGDSEVIPSPFIALWIDTGKEQLLIDTGTGHSQKPLSFQGREIYFKGNLLHILKREGIDPAGIDTVLLTHFHPDHIGGIFDESGQLNYPNATFLFYQKEWEFWLSDEAAMLPPIFDYFIQKQIVPLQGHRIHGMPAESREIREGIQILFTPGHTPGHMAVLLDSEGEQLLYISDAFLHPMQLENPKWQTVFDHDHAQAFDTKTKLLLQAVQEEWLICAFHFPFPGLGYVQKESDHWVWSPLELADDSFSSK